MSIPHKSKSVLFASATRDTECRNVKPDSVSEYVVPRPMVSYETISRILPIADLAIILGSSILAVLLVVKFYPVYIHAGLSALYGIGLIASGLYVFRMRDLDFYDTNVLGQSRIEFRQIIGTWIVSAVVLLSLIYLLKFDHLDIRRGFLTFAVITPVLLVSWRMLIKRLMKYALENNAIGRRNAIVIGESSEFASPDCENILNRMGLSGATRFALAGKKDEPLTEGDRGVLDTAIAFVEEHNVTEALIMAGWGHPTRIKQLRGALRPLPIAACLLPDRQIRSLTTSLSDGPIQFLQIELQRAPLTRQELAVKRAMDILLSMVAITLFAVPMLVVGALIRLGSPGPVIFRQQRIGFNRRPFTIYKFRTMCVQEEGAAVRQAKAGDARVTRIGRILRATSVDEIPQIFNVLLGDMSIVGPRPHAIVHDHEFEAEVAEYAYRRRVKPGITGWAQCKGSRGPTPTVDHVRQRVELDLWYITNWSVLLDIYIIVKTAAIFLRQKNAL